MREGRSAQLGLLALAVLCLAGQQASGSFVARRAADDARPLSRVQADSPVVMGRFRAPAPEQIARHRMAKSSQLGLQTVGASFRVADEHDQASPSSPEKVVHGVAGSSLGGRQDSKQVKVGARMQVSDEGLNYPPSKLSADIYGNVAEIVTAPPEALESDFLIPASSSFSRRSRFD